MSSGTVVVFATLPFRGGALGKSLSSRNGLRDMGRGDGCGGGGKAVLRELALCGAGDTARLRNGLLEERFSDKPTGEGWRSVGTREQLARRRHGRHEAGILKQGERVVLRVYGLGVWSVGASYWVQPSERPLSTCCRRRRLGLFVSCCAVLGSAKVRYGPECSTAAYARYLVVLLWIVGELAVAGCTRTGQDEEEGRVS